MKILHSADWHLGAMLGVEKRYQEFVRMKSHLLELIRQEKIEALVIAGDVFDSYSPSNSATGLYYDFLTEAGQAGVRQIVVTAGNHDSPSYLEAPKSILERLSIHVIGHYDSDHPASMLIPLKESDGRLVAVVCAVPFLRERDVPMGEDFSGSRDEAYVRGILACYQKVCACCRETYPGVPQIVTGHFYATGGRGSGDHVVGNLTNVPVSKLPEGIAYLALGHLHAPQLVGGNPHRRYSGSLLHMNFAEVMEPKSVVILDTDDLTAEPRTVALPMFQRMEKVVGDMAAITERLTALRKEPEESIWVHVENTGPYEPNLRQKLQALCEDSGLRVLSFGNVQDAVKAPAQSPLETKSLSELRPLDVFNDLLRRKNLSEEQRASMLEAYKQVMRELAEEDTKA